MYSYTIYETEAYIQLQPIVIQIDDIKSIACSNTFCN